MSLIKIEFPNINKYYCSICEHDYRNKYGLTRHKKSKKHLNLTQRPTKDELDKIKQYPRLAELPTRKDLQNIKLRDSFSI